MAHLICLVLGHEDARGFERDRMYVHCLRCGRISVGLEITPPTDWDAVYREVMEAELDVHCGG